MSHGVATHVPELKLCLPLDAWAMTSSREHVLRNGAESRMGAERGSHNAVQPVFFWCWI